MYDLAQVNMVGRATADAQFFNLDDEERTTRATFTMACNLSFKRKGEIEVRSVFRRILVLGSFAKYLHDCQEDDGLKGRLIILSGKMDNELNTDEHREIILVSPIENGYIKVIDRKSDV